MSREHSGSFSLRKVGEKLIFRAPESLDENESGKKRQLKQIMIAIWWYSGGVPGEGWKFYLIWMIKSKTAAFLESCK